MQTSKKISDELAMRVVYRKKGVNLNDNSTLDGKLTSSDERPNTIFTNPTMKDQIQ